jgi:TonB family protein
MSLWTRFLNLFRKGRLEREFDEELRFHLEKRAAKSVQQGVSQADAQAEALRQFGSTSRLKREMQEIRVMKTSVAIVLAALVIVVGAGAFVWLRGGDSTSSARYYRVSDEGVTSPSVIHEQKPNYPKEAMQAKIQGAVLMKCIVQTTGICEDIQVAQSLDPMWLDQEAVKAMQEWRFRPGTLMGRPVPVIVNVEMRFTVR